MKNLGWLEPSVCDPPHRVTHPDKRDDLAERFARYGWGPNHPVLIGYPLDGRIQLLSGSHRWAAARLAGIQIPVLMKSYEEVTAAYGDLYAWQAMMQTENIP